MTKLTIASLDGETVVQEPSVTEINRALAQLSEKLCDFVILDSNRGFIQARWCLDESGANTDLLVELRLNLAADYFEHYSLQNAKADGDYFHEMQAVLPLFWSFLSNDQMPSGIAWVNVKDAIEAHLAAG